MEKSSVCLYWQVMRQKRDRSGIKAVCAEVPYAHTIWVSGILIRISYTGLPVRMLPGDVKLLKESWCPKLSVLWAPKHPTLRHSSAAQRCTPAASNSYNRPLYAEANLAQNTAMVPAT